MSLSITTDPNLSVSGYDSIAASTTQLRYVLAESDMSGKTDYYVKITISELTDFTLYYVMRGDGSLIVDLGQAIEQAMLAEGLTYVYYRLTCQAFYSSTSDTAINSDYTFAVISRVPIKSSKQSNLWDYVAKPTNYGKFLTLFDVPKFWENWDLYNWIINLDYTGTTSAENEILDINLNILDTSSVGDIWAALNKVESYPLDYPAEANQKYLRFHFEVSTVQVTEQKLYKLEPECNNPVMIQWLNRLGGYDQYLFEREQTINQEAEQGIIWQVASSDDISTITETKKRRAAKDTQTMVLKAANLTQNELQALHDIKLSQDVKVWLAKTDPYSGNDWVNVIVNGGYADSFTTGKTGYTYLLTIEFPDNFDFFTAKQY